jgi:branched-chain amino acid transport system substrate-binding protein
MTTHRRTILRGAAATGALLAMPGLVRAQSPAIKIGILQPVTGALAQDGEYGRLGAEIALNEINNAGGIKSMGGARLQMVFGDARSNPEGGTAEVERMQAEGVAAIVGGFASPIVLAASQAASRYDIPYICDVGVSDQIVGRGLKNTFRFGPGFGNVTSTALENLVKLNDAAGKPARTVVIVHEDGLFGAGMAKLLQTQVSSLLRMPVPMYRKALELIRLRPEYQLI